MKCIACKKEHNENFSPNCGQQSNVKSISFKTIIQDGFVSISSMDKGFLFNLKSLILDPKNITTTYLLGKRKSILNPISFLIIAVTVYLASEALFKIKVEHPIFIPKDNNTLIGYEIGQKFSAFIITNFKYIAFLLLFPLSFATKICFRKYNYSSYNCFTFIFSIPCFNNSCCCFNYVHFTKKTT